MYQNNLMSNRHGWRGVNTAKNSQRQPSHLNREPDMVKKSLIILSILLSTLIPYLSAWGTPSTVSINVGPIEIFEGSTLGSAMTGDESMLDTVTDKFQKNVDGSPSLNLKTDPERDILALRKNNNIMLLAHTFGTQDSVTVSAESTAVSLVLFSPALLGLTPEQQRLTVPLIKTRPHFSSLIKRIQKNIETDARTPLDYWRHPFLASDVNRVIDELITTPEFSTITELQSIEQYQTTQKQQKDVERQGFTVTCKDDQGNPIPNCDDAATLSITNPKAVYYGAYIDENKSDILDAKEGLVNIELGLYPPKFNISSSKETEFPLDSFGNGDTSYNINLTREFGWNPLTPNGAATWMSTIKGLSILVEAVAASIPEVSRSGVRTWIGENAIKLKEISDIVMDKDRAREAILVIKVINYFMGQIYLELPDTYTYKESIGEVYYTTKKLTTIADKAIDLLKLDPINIDAHVDYYVNYFFQYESTSELLAVIRSGNDLGVIYEKINTKIVIEMQDQFSVFIMNNDISFDYDFALQKLSGLFTHLETKGLIDSILSLLLNDLVNDVTKKLAEFLLSNAFGLPYKIAAVSNKLVPYTWDMFTAPPTLRFPVYNGEIKALPEPTVSFFSIENEQGDRIYGYSPTNESNQNYVRITPGECLKVSYMIDMPENFQRGIDATDEWWTWLADYPEISNFKATLYGRFETEPWSGYYTRTKLLEKELEIYTQREWGIPNNGWNLNWYYGGEYYTLELDDDPDNWSEDQVPFKLNTLFENNTELCFPTEEEIPDQFILNFNNFNYESTGSFLINVRKPNQAPQIHSISSHAHSDNNQIYIFDKVELFDDYTREDDILLEVDYGDGTIETLQGAEHFSFSHEYATQGEYQVTFKAIDDEETYSEPWYETVYPGYAYPNAEISSSYVNFGNIEVGQQASQIVTIRNSGFADLEIGSFTLTGDAFQITANDCESSVLLPNESCNFTIWFQPVDKIDYSGEIIIPTNVPDTADITIQIAGAGIYDPNIPTDFAKIFKPYQTTDINGNIITVSTYTPSGVIYGNVKLESGTLNLDGQSLTIYGHLIHSGGNMKINEGSLTVKGDYRIQRPTSTNYSYSSGKLYMTNTNDAILVEGDFVMDSIHDHDNSYLTAGTLTVKGDFTQKSTYTSSSEPRYNFYASGTHKVILDGTSLQTISFEDPNTSYSHFNILKIANTSQDGVVFSTPYCANSLSTDSNYYLNSMAVSAMTWNLTADREIRGNLFLDGTTLNLNGKTLTVQGNLIHSNGSLHNNTNGGNLIIKGDYRIQRPTSTNYSYSSGKLYMTNTNDAILVEGDFVMDSIHDHDNSYLTAGTLTVKGDFTQKSTYTSSSEPRYNFYASGTHKVILDGTSLQTISFEDPNTSYSHFNILKIANTSQDGVVFSTPYCANSLSTDSNYYLNSMAVSAMTWNLTADREIRGNLFLDGTTLNLNGKTLTVQGNLIHSNGSLHNNTNGGNLIIKGDYRIQRPTSTNYSYSSGKLYMTNTNDAILVEGDFVMDSIHDHDNSYLTAGTLTVKGDFTQKSTYTSSSEPRYNFYASGTHKVILDGTSLQTISFEDPNASYSHFNILEITNTSNSGILFSTPVVITKLFNHHLNNFTLTQPSTFPDYDGDGITDEMDTDPVNGANCAPEDLLTQYYDGDNDGYGLTDRFIKTCEMVQGYVTDGGDCDDKNPLLYPGQTWYPDSDHDGYPDDIQGVESCQLPGDTYYLASELTAVEADNCPQVANPNQRDDDNNGIGDACEGGQSGMAMPWINLLLMD